MGAFAGRGMVIQGLRFLSPREALAALQDGALLVDLRSDELVEMKAFHVTEALHVPHRELLDQVQRLPADRPLLLADSSGVFTKDAAHFLVDHGFQEVACLNGGMLAWEQEGLPLDSDPAALLQGECACVMRSRKQRT